MHASLDGFVASANGKLNWVTVNDEIFDFVDSFTKMADTALYGRVTYQMMEAYWPTAGQKADASKHDKEHSRWYEKVNKVVLSRTLPGQGLKNTVIINDHLAENIHAIKQSPGNDILIFGSPAASHALLKEDLIDEFRIFVNPVLLGKGFPLFSGIEETIKLELAGYKNFSSGVVALHYKKKQ